MHFNSHAHVERDQPFTKTHVKDLNFNSHAHVERDCVAIFTRTISSISTHTLTWSVTRHNQNTKSSLYISTHTLTWSVTVCHSLASAVLIISTHTLTWSVT